MSDSALLAGLARLEARLARIEAVLGALPRSPVSAADDDPDAAELVERIRAECAEKGHQVVADTVDDRAVSALIGCSPQTLKNRRARGAELIPSGRFLGSRRTKLADLAEAALAGVVRIGTRGIGTDSDAC